MIDRSARLDFPVFSAYRMEERSEIPTEKNVRAERGPATNDQTRPNLLGLMAIRSPDDVVKAIRSPAEVVIGGTGVCR